MPAQHHASQEACKKRRRGEVELTLEDELVQAAISSQHTAELAVLHLLTILTLTTCVVFF